MLRKKLLIILLLIVGCSTEPQIGGCTVGQPSNFNKDATQDDGSCDFDTCVDRLGYAFTTAVIDSSGTCDAVPTNDCAGVEVCQDELFSIL